MIFTLDVTAALGPVPMEKSDWIDKIGIIMNVGHL